MRAAHDLRSREATGSRKIGGLYEESFDQGMKRIARVGLIRGALFGYQIQNDSNHRFIALHRDTGVRIRSHYGTEFA
jgi:hypothetical protein